MRYIIIKDKDGAETAYNTEEHGEDIISRVKTHVELHNRDNEDDQWSFYESEVWPPVEVGLEDYRMQALSNVSLRSYTERSEILDDVTISNILIGATGGYPSYLTASNVASMIEQFKIIAKQAKSEIQAAKSKTEIDDILKALKFPTEEQILRQLSES